MEKASMEDSIAVLPFRNLSSDPENEYFSDGVTEEIINALTRVEGLNVIARSSSFLFKGRDTDAREVGKSLNVSYVLEGSVRKSGNHVRVSARLIKAWDGFHIFSEVYDRELQDIFQVQDDISNKIVGKYTALVGLPLSDKKLVSSSTKDMEAYELYLKGRYHLSKGSLEACHAARQYFEAASARDPDFVLPVAGLAACFTFLGGSGMMDAVEAFEKAREYARQANRIDDSMADTHLALAKSAFWCDWDFGQTGEAMQKAIRIAPGTSGIHGFNSTWLMAAGRLDEALVEAQLAAKLDPLSLNSKFHLGELLYRSERYVEAMEIFEGILTGNPFYTQASIFKAWCHLFLGDPDAAIGIFQAIPLTGDKVLPFYGGLAMAHYKKGQYDRILGCMRSFSKEVETGSRHWVNYNYALIFRALDEKGKMLEYLKKGLEERNSPLIFIRVDPVWQEFRDDPAFKELIDTSFAPEKRIGKTTIKSETKEELQISLDSLLFIEAQENYSRVVWKEDHTVKERLLRATLKFIENQLNDDQVVRCHRSFIIHTRAGFTIQGNSGGYRLSSELFPDIIPVSRSLGKEIVARLREQ
jgi:adenylate cyclase